jgi:hypothetical protein
MGVLSSSEQALGFVVGCESRVGVTVCHRAESLPPEFFGCSTPLVDDLGAASVRAVDGVAVSIDERCFASSAGFGHVSSSAGRACEGGQVRGSFNRRKSALASFSY